MCCGQSTVEDLVRQQRSLRIMYAKNPVNQQLASNGNGNGNGNITSHPFAKPYTQPKMEMSPNGKYVKFVRAEKTIN